MERWTGHPYTISSTTRSSTASHCDLKIGHMDNSLSNGRQANPDSKVHWGLHGAYLGPTGPRWAPCWAQDLCSLGTYFIHFYLTKITTAASQTITQWALLVKEKQFRGILYLGFRGLLNDKSGSISEMPCGLSGSGPSFRPLWTKVGYRRAEAPRSQDNMMTSSNGNIFCVTGPLCGEFTGPRWIPRTKASDAELWCFLWSALV